MYVGYVVAFSCFIYGACFSIYQRGKTLSLIGARNDETRTSTSEHLIFLSNITTILGGLGCLIAVLTQIIVIEVAAMIKLVNQESLNLSNSLSSLYQEYQLAKKSHKIWTLIAAIATSIGLFLNWMTVRSNEYPETVFSFTVVFQYAVLFFGLPHLLNIGSVYAKKSHYTTVSLFLSPLGFIIAILMFTGSCYYNIKEPQLIAGWLLITLSSIVAFIIAIFEARRVRSNDKISQNTSNYIPVPIEDIQQMIPFEFVPQPEYSIQQVPIQHIPLTQFPLVHFQNY